MAHSCMMPVTIFLIHGSFSLFCFFGNMFEIFLEECLQTITTTFYFVGLELPLFTKVNDLLIYFDFKETFKI